MEGVLGRKLGMTQVFDRSGEAHAATVIEAGPCLVTQVKTPDTDGYHAIQLGYGVAKRINSPMKGHLKKLGQFRYLREFRVDDASLYEVGQKLGVELFEPGDRVDITGISKGRGFAGGVRRYGFHGGPKTHGQSDRHRAPGAIGAGTDPGRVFKGQRMAGHMGNERVTAQNVKVLESNPARGVLIVQGAVPGARNGLLSIRRRKGAPPRPVTAEEPPTEEAQAEEAPPEEEVRAEEAPPEEVRAEAEEAPTAEAAAEEPEAEEESGGESETEDAAAVEAEEKQGE
jgi:large subunit ribosomal protein L3